MTTSSANRKIVRRECFLCESTGQISLGQRRQTCHECSGRGWTQPAGGDEIVCPTCNGDGSLSCPESTPCPYCQGKGYSVRIIEIRRQESPCAPCDGSGTIQGGKMKIECPQCKGHLWVMDSRNDVKLCPTCSGEGKISMRVDHALTCTVCKGTGQTVAEQEVDVTPQPQDALERLYRLEEDHRYDWSSAEWIHHAAAYKKLGKSGDEARCLAMAAKARAGQRGSKQD